MYLRSVGRHSTRPTDQMHADARRALVRAPTAALPLAPLLLLLLPPGVAPSSRQQRRADQHLAAPVASAKAAIGSRRSSSSVGVTKKQKKLTKTPWDVAVESHYAARRAAPTPEPREAYATMWWGDTSIRAFDGLKVMINSLRRFDTQREVVIMTPVPEHELQDEKPTDPNILRVQQTFQPVSVVRIPFLTIFSNTSKTCQSNSLGGCGVGTAKYFSSSTKKNPYDSYLFSFSKFAVWNLTAYTKILYVDNDVLVMQPLDGLWAVPLGTTRALAAASMAIKAMTYRGVREPQCTHDGLVPKGVRPGDIKFNAGIHMLSPSAILYAAIRYEMRAHWRHSFKSPCTGDQRYFNFLFARNHMHCWPLSANCRDPQFIQRESPPDASLRVSRLSRCLDSAPGANGTGTTTMAMPYMVHLSCNTKPWMPENSKMFFAAEWQRQLHEVNRRMGIPSGEQQHARNSRR